MSKPKIFIGSSSEAHRAGVLDQIVTSLGDKFEMRPWTILFENADHFLDKLLKESEQVDGAILIFAKDDKRELRGEKGTMARDNVILEFGLFLAALGKDRVHLLCENNVGMPSDLAGLKLDYFCLDDRAQEQASLNLASSKIARRWEHLKKRSQFAAPSTFEDTVGLSRTLVNARSKLHTIEEALLGWQQTSSIRIKGPFDFDSSSACKTAYAEALGKVTERFWTTTYLSSGFWTSADPELLEANTELLSRLSSSKGSARRLVLLGRRFEDEKAEQMRRLRFYRQQDDRKSIDEIHRKLKTLRSNFQQLEKEGCEVRVAHDEGDFQQLPRDLGFVRDDSELAIYDSFRVDVFDGGSVGKIMEVRLFCDATRNFRPLLESCERYFESLWDTAQPAHDFLEQLDFVHKSAERKIDYTTNWLAKYEFALQSEDKDLKTLEFKRVEEELRRRGKWGEIKNYLDIGTCTGRYPLGLREAVAEDGSILGIDDDDDCLVFAKTNMQNVNDRRIRFEHVDFASPDFRFDESVKYDLITCMLGTLSHFQWSAPDAGNARATTNYLGLALDRVHSLLSDDGLFVMGIWSDEACFRGTMLSIYQKADVDRLARWTPRRRDFVQLLKDRGFTILTEAKPEVRLDFYVCERKRKPKGSMD